MTRNAKTSQSSLLTICLCVQDESYDLSMLDSLLEDVKEEPISIIFIDPHHSKQASVIEEELAKKDSRITYFKCSEPNLASAIDQAWQGTKTDWVAFIDLSCRLVPGWFSCATNDLSSRFADLKCAGISGGTLYTIQDTLLFSAYSLIPSSEIGNNKSLLLSPATTRREVIQLPAWNAIYRVSALKKAGGFSNEVRHSLNALNLAQKLKADGFELWSCPGMVVEKNSVPSKSLWIDTSFRLGRKVDLNLTFDPHGTRWQNIVFPLAAVLYMVLLFSIIIFHALLMSFITMIIVQGIIIAFLLKKQDSKDSNNFKEVFFLTSVVGISQIAFGVGIIFQLLARKFKTNNSRNNISD